MITLYRYLINIKGISHFWANKICTLIGVNKNIKHNELSDHKLDILASIISKLKKSDKLILRNLDVQIKLSIAKLGSSYRGRRHVLRLPVNGQRTRSNAKTVKRRNVNSSSY